VYPFYGVGYGYQWWMSVDMNLYQALGRFGQRIMVSPAEDMVVVFTASIQGEDYHPHEELYLDYILEAIIGPPKTIVPTTLTSTEISQITSEMTSTITTQDSTYSSTITTSSAISTTYPTNPGTDYSLLLVGLFISTISLIILVLLTRRRGLSFLGSS
jgi:CubicO group peptidase (beta-lactamase class C family)